MLKRSRLLRWTFAEFHKWSAGIRERRAVARRFNMLVRSPKAALMLRRSSPSELRPVLIGAL